MLYERKSFNNGRSSPGSGGTLIIPVSPSSQPRLSPPPSPKRPSGVFIPRRALLPIAAVATILIGQQFKAFYNHFYGSSSRFIKTAPLVMPSMQGMQMQGDSTISECRWYLAESATPNGGLGVFTALSLHKDDMVGFPDICIFVGDSPSEHADHLHSHSYGSGMFFGGNEGHNNRAACEGFTTLFNTAPPALQNSVIVSPVMQTNAKLHRATSPGAGAITHHYGITAKAKDVIIAGSELVVDYFDWEFEEPYYRSVRNVSFLQNNGWCIDNLYAAQSPIPDAGRGAFARRPVVKGDTVAPAPLQVFLDRAVFQSTKPEQLFVNYCLQPKDSTLMFFPYGPLVGLINHAIQSDGYTPNVAWRWSTQTNSTRHNSDLLNPDLPLTEFWEQVEPSMLILEVYALRDIAVGEELLLDYGAAWEAAWKKHVASWKPLPDASDYVYPTEMDDASIVRTVKEQAKKPYPKNIGTVCATADWSRTSEDSTKNKVEWKEPKEWFESMTCCHILERKWDRKTDSYLYYVELKLSNGPEDFTYNPDTPIEERIIDIRVPRRAIRFMEIPYMDDEHMQGVFRHTMEFPDELVPRTWRNQPL